MVFQGTVREPHLCNVFWGECICADNCCGFEVVIYANGCNAFRCFPRNLANDAAQIRVSKCQPSAHAWGSATRVTFDSGKEDIMIISTVDLFASLAKLPSIEFDNKFVMATTAYKRATKTTQKTNTFLRTRRCYSTTDWVMLHNSHMLLFIKDSASNLNFQSASELKHRRRPKEVVATNRTLNKKCIVTL